MDYRTSIVCSECDYQRRTTEENPTLAGTCPVPECDGTLRYGNEDGDENDEGEEETR